MYIKVRPYYDANDLSFYYEYCILAANNVVMALSDWLYKDKAEAIRAAKKLAAKLKIRFQETN